MKSSVISDNSDLSSKVPLDFLADRRWKIFAPGVLFTIIIGLFAPLFLNPGTHLITDQPMWTAFTKVLQEEILPEQKWFWGILSDRENAGLTMGESYSLNIILFSVFSLFLSADASVKIFLLISVLFFSMAFYFVCRKMMNPIFSAVAALFVFVAIHQNAIKGMGYSHLSMGFAFCFWIISIRFFSSPNPRLWILSVILLSLTIYAHPLGFILGSVIWITLLVFGILTRSTQVSGIKLAVYALIPIVAILLAGPQIWAMMSSSTEKAGELSYLKAVRDAPLSWNFWLTKVVKIQFSEILRVDSLLLFILVGFLVFLKMDPKIKWPVCGIYLGGLLLCSEATRLLPFQPSVFLSLAHFSWRFPIYLHIVFIILAGIGFDYLAKKTLAMVSSFPLVAKDLRRFRFLIIFLALGLCFIQVRTVYTQREDLFLTLKTFDRKEDLHHLWEWLSKNVDAGETRVYFEDTYGTYPWRTQQSKSSSRLNQCVHKFEANRRVVRFCHPVWLSIQYRNGWISLREIEAGSTYEFNDYRTDEAAELQVSRGE